MRVSIVSISNIMAVACLCVCACSTRGPGIFTRNTNPHEQYGQHITDAGLRETALGRLWFQAALQSLATPLTISLPYAETGYFAAEQPQAAGLLFNVKRGEKIRVTLTKKPASGFLLYLDMWQPAPDGTGKPKLLASADTLNSPLEYDITYEGRCLVRIQPELLKSGEYSLAVTSVPSLAFPLPAKAKPNIGSFWGAGRDKGARKHEGIDIFAPFRTPALAAADGAVTRVDENTLGGKVVFLRPDHKDYTLYYAHLDTQFVHDGQRVRTGDTIGLTGNTGNAKYTPSHLHFGIYTFNGAIDPLPFVQPTATTPTRVSASTENFGRPVRASRNSRLYSSPDTKQAGTLTLESNTLLFVEAATGSWYKVTMPGGHTGFVSSTAVSAITDPLKQGALLMQAPLLDTPDSTAPRKKILPLKTGVSVLALYREYYYIKDQQGLHGWITKKAI